MATTARTQFFLAGDPHFRTRLRNAGSVIAWQVLDEDPGTANHTQRANYARNVLSNLDVWAAQQSASIVTRTNLNTPEETTFDYDIGAHVTTATDAEIESQLATDWNDLAGV